MPRIKKKVSKKKQRGGFSSSYTFKVFSKDKDDKIQVYNITVEVLNNGDIKVNKITRNGELEDSLHNPNESTEVVFDRKNLEAEAEVPAKEPEQGAQAEAEVAEGEAEAKEAQKIAKEAQKLAKEAAAQREGEAAKAGEAAGEEPATAEEREAQEPKQGAAQTDVDQQAAAAQEKEAPAVDPAAAQREAAKPAEPKPEAAEPKPEAAAADSQTRENKEIQAGGNKKNTKRNHHNISIFNNSKFKTELIKAIQKELNKKSKKRRLSKNFNILKKNLDILMKELTVTNKNRTKKKKPKRGSSYYSKKK